MNRGIYATATGMASMQQWMDVVTNNLANASTIGFKRDTLAFNDLFQRELRANGGDGAPVGSLGSGGVALRQATVFEKGALNRTGNPLDLAVDSDRGLFAVERPDGGRFYTRDGSFRLDETNQLVTKDGDLVLDTEGSPITLGAGTVHVAENGQITLNDAAVAQVGVFDGDFKKVGSNLYSSDNATPVEAGVQSGVLEGSNVNPVEAMIEMIKLNRVFELSQKSIQQQDELTGQLIQSLRDQ